MGIPQGILMDGQSGGCRLGSVEKFVVAVGEVRAERGVNARRVLGCLLGRHHHEGHGREGLERERSTLGH